jgi:hypothetical protein
MIIDEISMVSGEFFDLLEEQVCLPAEWYKNHISVV